MPVFARLAAMARRLRGALARAGLALAGVVLVAAVGVPAQAQSPAQSSAQADDVAETVQSALQAAGVAPSDYGLVVRPISGAGVTLNHNRDTPFNPASTMKLVTTRAALGLLGADYRWITGIYTNGRLEQGTLYGDLIIKGGGDPKLVIEDMFELVAKLRSGGLGEIRGDLLIDDSLYGVSAERQPAFDGDTMQPYNVGPYAALMNFKATKFIVNPKKRTVTLDPPLADVRIENNVRVLNGRCRRGGTGFSIEDAGTEARPVIRVHGAMVGACGEAHFYAAALSHRQFIHGLFKAAWKSAGGTMLGTTRVVPGAAKGDPYYQWYSPRTLAEIVRDVNKYSNNVMARMLVLQMGAQFVHQPASVDDARSAMLAWYAGRKLPLRSLVLENGSGLSRSERISAGDLTDILAEAAAGPEAATFEESLPQVGIDGTMRLRLRRDPVAGKAFIKTGTLRHVRAIAGYVTASSGAKYAVALLVNGPHAERAARAQDALLRWVYQNG